MKKISLIFWAATAAVLGLAQAASEPEIEEGVMVLNDSNFNEVISKNDYLLVEFYAPWW